MQIRVYEQADEQALLDLWEQVLPDAAPHNDPRVSLENKLRTGDGLLLVATLDGQIVGTVMGGYDGHRGWVYSLAVLPQARRRGIGTALCRKLEQLLQDRGCLKLNLQVRSNNTAVIAFYEKLGFAIEQRASLGKRLDD
jgi:ribosomal protein S18 acetylase RimI-like enzyme